MTVVVEGVPGAEYDTGNGATPGRVRAQPGGRIVLRGDFLNDGESEATPSVDASSTR